MPRHQQSWGQPLSQEDKRRWAIEHKDEIRDKRDRELGYEDRTRRSSRCLTCGRSFDSGRSRSRGHQPPIRLLRQWRQRNHEPPYQPVVIDQCLVCNLKQGYQLLHEWRPDLPPIEVLLRDGLPEPPSEKAARRERKRAEARAEELDEPKRERERLRYERAHYAGKAVSVPLEIARLEAQLAVLLRDRPREWPWLVRVLFGLPDPADWSRRVNHWRARIEAARLDLASSQAKLRALEPDAEPANVLGVLGVLDAMVAGAMEEEASRVNSEGWLCPVHHKVVTARSRSGRVYRICPEPTCEQFATSLASTAEQRVD